MCVLPKPTTAWPSPLPTWRYWRLSMRGRSNGFDSIQVTMPCSESSVLIAAIELLKNGLWAALLSLPSSVTDD